MRSNVSQPAVHSLLPTIHLCSSTVNSQTAERGNAAICKPGGGEAQGAEARLSAVRRNRQRCRVTEQAGWGMKEAAEWMAEPRANTFPLLSGNAAPQPERGVRS